MTPKGRDAMTDRDLLVEIHADVRAMKQMLHAHDSTLYGQPGSLSTGLVSEHQRVRDEHDNCGACSRDARRFTVTTWLAIGALVISALAVIVPLYIAS